MNCKNCNKPLKRGKSYCSNTCQLEYEYKEYIYKWKNGLVIPGKTIICGHWHCSWGWSHIDQRRKEFPDKSRRNWKKSFEPYVKEGIMAIDACTAYTEFVNCIILEV